MIPNVRLENTTTGNAIRHKLMPAARIANNSLSYESRLKAEIDAIKQAIGIVNTKKDGIK